MYCSLMAEYSSWPAVSSTSSRATSSSMTHCFRYESRHNSFVNIHPAREPAGLESRAREREGGGRGPGRASQRRTIKRRVIFVDKVALDQLDGKTLFTDTTASYHDKLVLSKELRRWGASAERRQRGAGGDEEAAVGVTNLGRHGLWPAASE